MQGNNKVVDIDALLAERKMRPVMFKLGGTEYEVRTDLTVTEVNQFIALTQSNNDAQAMTILVGTSKERAELKSAMEKAVAGEDVELPVGAAARKLTDYLETLPRLHVALASANIYRASKVLRDFALTDEDILRKNGMLDDEETSQGESSAS